MRTPCSAAEIIPSSSETGINAPLKPPTALDAIIPPFFTASLSNARAAVVPCVPHTLNPIASKIRATESPTAGVGARERSKIPNGILSILEASCPINSPTRVILNAVFFTTSATSVSVVAWEFSNASFTTPGPETPTLITASASPEPWKAPAIKGLSSTALQNTTILAQPKPSGVISAVCLIISPANFTASILMPARVEPIFTELHTMSVVFIASGIERINTSSEGDMPFCTNAEKPPINDTPIAFAARSRVWAIET